MAPLRIGISGWNYPAWRGVFYPSGLAQRRELEYATRVFNSLEINGTFYSLKTPQTFAAWRGAAPDGFLFAVKGSRYISHILRLRDARQALANFFASGVLRLEKKLGPILWQLPPQMDFEPEHVEAFCQLLPRHTLQAARLAREHGLPRADRAWFDVRKRLPLRYAFEVRDMRMLNDQLVQILRRYGHALAVADTAGEYPVTHEITADFVYIRLHGSRELYVSGYRDEELAAWSRRIRKWAQGEPCLTTGRGRRQPPTAGRDVYVYFDNDAHGHAPYDALRLARILGVAQDVDRLVAADGTPLPAPPRFKSAVPIRR